MDAESKDLFPSEVTKQIEIDDTEYFNHEKKQNNYDIIKDDFSYGAGANTFENPYVMTAR
jgi:hypothetical protein